MINIVRCRVMCKLSRCGVRASFGAGGSGGITGNSELDECTAIVHWLGYKENNTHAHCVYWAEKGKVSA
jgi:hypothetical protein